MAESWNLFHVVYIVILLHNILPQIHVESAGVYAYYLVCMKKDMQSYINVMSWSCVT